MTINCLAPGFIKLFYNSNGHEHTMTLNVSPANSTASILNTRSAGTQAFDAAIDAIVANFKGMFNVADHFTGAEVYTQADCTSLPVFRFAYDLGGPVAGTNAGADHQWQQCDLTFRSANGGKMKLRFLESAEQENDLKLANSAYSAGTAVRVVTDYLFFSGSVVTARDNSFPAFALNVVTKVNDTLRKTFLNP